jgi:hypothetical protein
MSHWQTIEEDLCDEIRFPYDDLFSVIYKNKKGERNGKMGS